MKSDMAYTARVFLLRLAVAAGIVVVFALVLHAGGPKRVAGTSYFDSTMTGQPLIWPTGFVTYYTDQGDLSPALPNAAANNFVAGAFGIWTSVPTAALAGSSGGALAEDVSGTNVTLNADGTISMPADIQSTATGTPIGVVYDSDGAVIDALVGAGAGDSSQCFFNAVVGGNDNFGSLATYQHALIVINGQCVQQSSQLTDVEYRLVRVIGEVLGMGWSQLNTNVQTGSPFPSSNDYAGFPVMHFTDLWNCVPITLCYPNPYQLSMDDAAAISRLYPVTAQNQSSFPGKQVFSATTARIHGSVYFTDSHGNRTQAMQGVNVVARWIDPTTGLPSRRYAASSESGFLFNGNAGNPITGYVDALGDPFTEWGSNNSGLEGFFDLSGLQPPSTGAQYQLTVEVTDPKWSTGVGPYAPGPVALSGVAAPITVTVSPGNDLQQDILMGSTAQPLPQSLSSWSSPRALPAGGDWMASLGGVGETDYYLLPAQANRTLSIATTALDESGSASEIKAQPVIGMWAASDPQGTAPPAFTSSPFNQIPFGMTRLDVTILTSTNFLIGVSDVRGDGRPDYPYHARVLYADSVSPARVGVNGGVITLHGTGFAPGLTASIGTTSASLLAISAGQLTLAAPAHADGLQNITVSDALSGASTAMTGVLTYGAASTDNIILLNGSNPSTPAGVQAANPVSVKVLAADGVTPVNGATIGWSGTNGVQLSACGGASSCSGASDQSGNASSWLTASAAGVATITATLAPGVYSPSKSVNATLSATESSSDIGATTPYLFISQGATISVPLTARVLSNGTPRNNVQVNFTLVTGTGTLSNGSGQSNASGYATVTLSLTQIAALVQVSACVAPGNAPCGMFNLSPVPVALQRLQQVSGAGQVSTGPAFQAVVVRVTDSAAAPNPVMAAPVIFLTTVLRPGGTASGGGGGETNSGNPAMPVILKVTQSSATTDTNGLASIVPSGGGYSAPVEVDVGVTAGTSAALDDPLQVFAPPYGGSASSDASPPPATHPISIPMGGGQIR
ncbi:MAG TPA: IPT/TIG domain-containing protein [Candidatus Dormibacteraeota bacterium]|nr:IPT/TIG domain-containing protein [Candidatus Dormibacteraeota bacterium]